MQLKSFTDTSTSVILARIKEELGSDAIILDTKEHDGQVTITAALERTPTIETNGHDDTSFGRQFSQPQGWQQWHKEWDSIKSHILTLMKPQLRLDKLQPRQRVALEFLQKEGVGDEVILVLAQKLQESTESSILDPLSSIVKVVPWGLTKWKQRVHVIAGPYGAGKTSVTMRMALALRKAKPDLRICLINADATRGNGRLLLKHYSELSDLEYKDASSTIELVDSLLQTEKERFDKVFVDLPGLSRGKYLQSLLEDSGLTGTDTAVHLALPPHYGEKHIRGVLDRYRGTTKGSIVWTKLDEAEGFGDIVNIAYASELPISSLSYGPGLGNSLSPATEVMVWKLLFKSELPNS